MLPFFLGYTIDIVRVYLQGTVVVVKVQQTIANIFALGVNEYLLASFIISAREFRLIPVKCMDETKNMQYKAARLVFYKYVATAQKNRDDSGGMLVWW